MAIFAIGDLHLPGQSDKLMDRFGAHWDHHWEAIQKNWIAKVNAEDIVLIPGDISWAMNLSDAVPDLFSISTLPGYKILLRGNHDYWWSSITKVRAALPASMYALQNDALALQQYVFCGARGWVFPNNQTILSEADEKIYQRELIRLKLSLETAQALSSNVPPIVLMHFPPLFADGIETEYTKLLEAFGICTVVYGHLHDAGIKNGFSGLRNGIQYHLVSCDALQFSPICVL